MTIRKKTFLTIAATVVGLIFLLFFSTEAILFRQFETHEYNHLQLDMTRVLDEVDNQLHNLQIIAADWAAWDDTYRFVQGEFPEYESQNIIPKTFNTLELNLMLFLDKNGALVSQHGFDLERQQPVDLTLPESLYSLPMLAATETYSGLTIIEERPMFLVARPILHSDYSGPVAGMLIVGRYWKFDEIGDDEQLMDLNLELQTLDEAMQSIDKGTLQTLLASPEPTIIQPIQNDSLTGHGLIQDILGQPTIVFTIQINPLLYQKDRQISLAYYIGVLLASGLAFAVVINALLERQVLSRIINLSEIVGQISTSGELSMRLQEEGNDEITRLSRQINRLLNSVSQTAEQLREDVTEREQAQTRLNRVNRALKLLSKINQTLVRATNQQTFIKEVCRILVMKGGYRLAWVGLAEHDEQKTVRPIAQWGYNNNYLEQIDISWDETVPQGRGPTGTAIRNNKPSIVQQITEDASYVLWQKAAQKRAFNASIALPLANKEGEVFGALNLYSSEPNAFDVQEVKMLVDLTNDLSFGINTLQIKAEHDAARQALEVSEERFRKLVSSVDDVIYMLDTEQRHTGVFGNWLNEANLTPEFFLGKSVVEVLGEEEGYIHQQANELALKGEHVVYEWAAPNEEETRYYQTSLSPLRNRHNEIIGLVGVGRDLTAQKQVEQQLKEERNFISAVLDTVGTLVVVLDPDGRIVRLNRTCEIITGHLAADVVGQPFWEVFMQANDITHIKEVFAEIKKRRITHTYISPLYTKDEENLLIDWTNNAMVNKAGEVEYIISTGIDITKTVETENIRLELEEQLRQAQKMESIGRLAGGVAHDFNNQLTAMIGYANLILRRLPDDASVRDDIAIILHAAERASNLTRQLLAFARRQAIDPVTLDLNDVILNVDKMLRRLIGENIELIILPYQGLWPLRADPGQLEQILFNMAVNALDAMPEGGKLTISTENATLDANYAGQYFDIRPGHYVRLKIEDTGTGMSEEVQAHIFEPFFTTKPTGKGTGLGLATCFGIVKQHNGHIFVESTPGKGSTFSVDWPRAEQPAQSLPDLDMMDEELPHGTETILLVEDEAAVRQMMKTYLERLGYTVLAANNGEEAIRVMQEQPEATINLLLTDMIMPKMGGRELAKHFRTGKHKQTKVMFMSGYTGEIATSLDNLDLNAIFLQKPFSMVNLAHKIRTALED